jgi:hypothetical protein
MRRMKLVKHIHLCGLRGMYGNHELAAFVEGISHFDIQFIENRHPSYCTEARVNSMQQSACHWSR